MKLKKLLVLMGMILFVAIFAVGCSSESSGGSNGNNDSGADDEEIKLKVATYFATAAQAHLHIVEPWTERVTELTDGKVQFDIYPAEQLGKASDLLNLTKGKTTDISVIPSNYFPDEMPLNSMLNGLPNMHETAYQGTMAYNELMKNNEDFMQSEFIDNGVRAVFAHVSPTYEIYSNKELRVPADIEGLKIRTPGGVASEYYDYLGAASVAVSFAELYEALERGVIEAASTSGTTIRSGGLEELLSYAVEPHVGSAINLIFVNEEVYNSLPEDVQQAMIQAGEDIKESSARAYAEEDQAFREEFQKENTIVELTEEEQAEWDKVNAEFIEQWLDKKSSEDVPYVEVLEEYKGYLEQFKE